MSKVDKFLWAVIAISCIIRPDYLYVVGGIAVIAILLGLVAIVL